MVDGELARRARVHAALGEPARLAIVDRLVPGDASPGELGAALGLATNLLAHHLRVLQDAGVIRRVRHLLAELDLTPAAGAVKVARSG